MVSTIYEDYGINSTIDEKIVELFNILKGLYPLPI